MDNIHTVVDKSGGLVDGLGTIGKMFVELGHTHQASLPPLATKSSRRVARSQRLY